MFFAKPWICVLKIPFLCTLFVQLEDLQKDLEEAKELANNRLQELDKLHLQHREALKEVEKLKMDVSNDDISDPNQAKYPV